MCLGEGGGVTQPKSHNYAWYLITLAVGVAVLQSSLEESWYRKVIGLWTWVFTGMAYKRLNMGIEGSLPPINMIGIDSTIRSYWNQMWLG